MQANTKYLSVSVWRGDVRAGELQQFQVPQQENQTILDLVTWIQREIDPGLSYRFSCRVGMCGSCAMTINGIPRWACRTHVQKVVKHNSLTIEPLRNLPVIRDLVCDMSEFFARWKQAEGQFRGDTSRDESVVRLSPDSPGRQLANAAIECINCAICYAACDVVSWNESYLGPAALNRAWSLLNDERDRYQLPRLKAVASGAGCYNCHSHQSCARYCPNELNPTASIAGLKRMATMAALKGEL
ncbi:MAG: succinate dehydrogenase/fumarate reductase iron-sulfur subunit [Gammaproteobacteria bacterium]